MERFYRPLTEQTELQTFGSIERRVAHARETLDVIREWLVDKYDLFTNPFQLRNLIDMTNENLELLEFLIAERDGQLGRIDVERFEEDLVSIDSGIEKILQCMKENYITG